MTRVARAAALWLATAGAAWGDPGPIAVNGAVAHPGAITLAQLQGAPVVRVTTDVVTEHGARHSTYTGQLLWKLLSALAVTDAPGRKTHLQHVFLVRGRDGYTVSLAIGEIEPEFEGKQVLLAYARDGKALDGIELVVPGDKEAARYVRDVVAIEVR